MKIIGVKNDRLPGTLTCQVSVVREGALLTFNVVTTDTLVEDSEADNYRIEDTYTVDLAALRTRRDWCDHQVYFLATEARKLMPLMSLYETTLETRESAHDYAARNKISFMIGINVPTADSTDDDLFVTVNLAPNAAEGDLVVSAGLEKVWSEASSSGTERVLRMPHIKATGPQSMAPNTTAVVQVRLEDATGNLLSKNATVLVDAINGFSGATRVQIVNGLGQFPVSSDGQLPGSTLRMKLGWKFYVGVEDVYIPVV